MQYFFAHVQTFKIEGLKHKQLESLKYQLVLIIRSKLHNCEF